MWPCDHACHPRSEPQHWRKGREPCSSWGLKNSFQPQKLNGPESITASQPVQQWLYADHGSATLPKWHVRLRVLKSQKPNRYQKTLFLRGKQGSFYLSSVEETIPPALPRWQLGGEQAPVCWFCIGAIHLNDFFWEELLPLCSAKLTSFEYWHFVKSLDSWTRFYEHTH